MQSLILLVGDNTNNGGKNYKIGLSTNFPGILIKTVLQNLNISHLFQAIAAAASEEKGMAIACDSKLGCKQAVAPFEDTPPECVIAARNDCLHLYSNQFSWLLTLKTLL